MGSPFTYEEAEDGKVAIKFRDDVVHSSRHTPDNVGQMGSILNSAYEIGYNDGRNDTVKYYMLSGG